MLGDTATRTLLAHPFEYDGDTAHASEAGDALVAHPGLVSGPIHLAKEGH